MPRGGIKGNKTGSRLLLQEVARLRKAALEFIYPCGKSGAELEKYEGDPHPCETCKYLDDCMSFYLHFCGKEKYEKLSQEDKLKAWDLYRYWKAVHEKSLLDERYIKNGKNNKS